MGSSIDGEIWAQFIFRLFLLGAGLIFILALATYGIIKWVGRKRD